LTEQYKQSKLSVYPLGFSESGEFGIGEAGQDACKHSGVFYGDGQVLVICGFPVYAGKLIDVIEDCEGLRVKCAMTGLPAMTNLCDFYIEREVKIALVAMFAFRVVV